MQNQITTEHRPKAWAISILLYLMLLGALYFLKIAYEPINIPLELGVDLNYGTDNVGSGDIQTLNHANDSKNNYDVKPDNGPKESAQKPVEKSTPPPPPEKSIAKQAPVITADEDSKVVIKKTSEKVSKVVAPSYEKTKPTKVVSTAPTAVVKTEPKKVVDQGSLFKKPGASNGSNGTVGTRSGVGGNNNGDGAKGEVGDKGSPKGTLDGKSLYGNPGNGGGKSSGASVNISGWKNKGPLNIAKDQSNEVGRIRFKLIVDDYGDVVKIDVIESSVSPSVTNYYKNQVTQKLKSNLIPEGTPPPRSSGTITINITRG